MVFETSFSAWAYRVLSFKIQDHVKRARTRRRLDEQLAEGTDRNPSAPADQQLLARLISCFRKVSRSNPRHARILNLHYQGYSTREICEKMSISSNNLYVVLSRARKALESCLEKVGDD